MTLVLGVNAYHGDSAAGLLEDGRPVAAVAEERLNRQKHWSGFPERAVQAVLAAAGAEPADLDAIAVNRDPRAARGRRLAFLLARRPSPRLVASRLGNRARWRGLPAAFAALPGWSGRIPPMHWVEHHRAHLAAAYHLSPFREAAAVSLDGSGDFCTAALGGGAGAALRIAERSWFPHSLGVFYQAMAQYLGFWDWGAEYKVMGLAAHGTPRHLPALRRVLRVGAGGFRLDLGYFRHHRVELNYAYADTVPAIGRLYSTALCDLLGPERGPGAALTDRHRDLAASVQGVFEEAVAALLARARELSGSRSLVLAGGCAENARAAGRLPQQAGFARVYQHPASGDAGGAVGAALCAHLALTGSRPAAPLERADLGPRVTAQAIDAALAEAAGALAAAGIEGHRIAEEPALIAWTADRLAAGALVGWLHGGAEWGPRALGHRSILADPRRAEVVARLNARIKRREPFRPFAPAVPEAHAADWFELDRPVPFMTEVHPVRPARRGQIPAVVHADGSARVQTVRASATPRFHALLTAFGARTGVPVLLNTSFNENEPIVSTAGEALACFLRTGLDALVLEDRVLVRPGAQGVVPGG